MADEATRLAILNVTSISLSGVMLTSPVTVFFPIFRFYLVRWGVFVDTPLETPERRPAPLETPPLSFVGAVLATLLWGWISWFSLGPEAWALRLCNSYGLPISLLFLGMYMQFYKRNLYEKQLRAQFFFGLTLFLGLLLFCSICLLLDHYESTPTTTERHPFHAALFYECLSWIAMVCGLIMYAHPLAEMRRVLRTNNCEKFGSFSMNCVAFVNCSCWTVQGFLLASVPLLLVCGGSGVVSLLAICIRLFVRFRGLPVIPDDEYEAMLVRERARVDDGEGRAPRSCQMGGVLLLDRPPKHTVGGLALSWVFHMRAKGLELAEACRGVVFSMVSSGASTKIHPEVDHPSDDSLSPRHHGASVDGVPVDESSTPSWADRTDQGIEEDNMASTSSVCCTHQMWQVKEETASHDDQAGGFAPDGAVITISTACSESPGWRRLVGDVFVEGV